MTALPTSVSDAVSPSESDAEIARQSSRRLTPFMHKDLRFKLGETEEPVELPAAVVNLLVRVLSEMAHGNAVTLVPIHAELTTQQAADLLGVSRPFIVKQLDNGVIPYRKIGTHRRILFHDLMQYKDEIDAMRSKSLDQLAAESQRLKLEY